MRPMFAAIAFASCWSSVRASARCCEKSFENPSATLATRWGMPRSRMSAPLGAMGRRATVCPGGGLDNPQPRSTHDLYRCGGGHLQLQRGLAAHDERQVVRRAPGSLGAVGVEL